MIELFKFNTFEPPAFFSEIDEFVNNADSSKGFQQKHYPEHFSSEFVKQFKPWFEQLIDVKSISGPTHGFVNISKFTGIRNETPWHNEGGFSNGLEDPRTGEVQVCMEKDYVVFFWLQGERGHGGALRFIEDQTGNMGIAELAPPGFILATKNTLHSVEHYSGTKFRVNFTVDFSVDQ